jgi:hypothetical protein
MPLDKSNKSMWFTQSRTTAKQACSISLPIYQKAHTALSYTSKPLNLRCLQSVGVQNHL